MFAIEPFYMVLQLSNLLPILKYFWELLYKYITKLMSLLN